jgi:hypothetical protein
MPSNSSAPDLLPTKLTGCRSEGVLMRCRREAGTSGCYDANNTNHIVWLKGRAGPQRALGGDSGYPMHCPLS